MTIYQVSWLCFIDRVNIYSRVYLNGKELLARNSRYIWSSCDSNGIRTNNHLVRKGTLNNLAKLTSLIK